MRSYLSVDRSLLEGVAAARPPVRNCVSGVRSDWCAVSSMGRRRHGLEHRGTRSYSDKPDISAGRVACARNPPCVDLRRHQRHQPDARVVCGAERRPSERFQAGCRHGGGSTCWWCCFPARPPPSTPCLTERSLASATVRRKPRGSPGAGKWSTQILTRRISDQFDALVAQPSGSGAGVWVPTPPAFGLYLLPQWAFVAPFAMPTSDYFQPCRSTIPGQCALRR